MNKRALWLKHTDLELVGWCPLSFRGNSQLLSFDFFFSCLVFSLLSSWDSNDTYVRPLWSCYTCLLCSVLLFILFALLCMSWETFPLCLSSRPLLSAMAGLLLMPSVEFWIPDVLFFTCKVDVFCCRFRLSVDILHLFTLVCASLLHFIFKNIFIYLVAPGLS